MAAVRLRELLHPGRAASPVLAIIVAVALPAAGTGLALLIDRKGPVSAVSLYLLAVVLAATAGGIRVGVGAAVVSSLGFTFFFTAPQYTFRVERREDIVAAGVFLVVAVVVGLLVARISDERERASRREQDARLLGYLATRLLSGEPLSVVLDDFAGALLDPFQLVRCEVVTTMEGERVEARAERGDAEQGTSEVVPIAMGTVAFGTLTAVRSSSGPPFSATDRSLLEAAAKQAAFALERARLYTTVRGAELEAESNQLRAALFSSVTHDLRTPLASIKAGVTSLLSEEASIDASQQRELLTTILEETDRLNRLVGNIMDLARIRAGALEPAREPASVDEIVAAVVARMRVRLGTVDVRTNLRADLPDVSVDPVQIDQVLTNLLENAASHSPPGGEIVISAAPYRDAIVVRVADRGPGIPPEDRERVFEAFFRGDAAPERSGSGLGLAIARAIVTAHGGRIWIEGAPGGGTVVVFELPVEDGRR